MKRTIAFAAIAFIATTCHAQRYAYTVVDVGIPSGDAFSRGLSLNNRSQAVGLTRTAGSLFTSAFLWQHGVIAEIAGPQVSGNPFFDQRAVKINNRGDVLIVGTVSGVWHSDCPPGQYGTDCSSGTLELGPFGFGSVADMNSRGDVVAGSLLWRRSDNSIVDLSPITAASAVNDGGDVVGTDAAGHVILWRNGVAQDLGEGNPHAINNSGDIVGDWHGQPVLWTKGAMQILSPALPGASGGSALSINNRGEIVGFELHLGSYAESHCQAQAYVPFLWKDGTAVALPDQIPPDSGWDIKCNKYGKRGIPVTPQINDLGQIIGTGFKGDVVEPRAYMLDPH